MQYFEQSMPGYQYSAPAPPVAQQQQHYGYTMPPPTPQQQYNQLYSSIAAGSQQRYMTPGPPQERYGMPRNNECSLGPLSTPGSMNRSKLLEDFRASSGNNIQSLRDLQGHVFEFAQDQHGSR